MHTALIFLAVFMLSDGAKILGLFPHTGRSHQMVFDPLLRTLAERGHHLTVASFFPLKNPPENYTNVNLQGIGKIELDKVDLTAYENSSLVLKLPVVGETLSQLPIFHMLAEIALNVCENILNWPPLTAVFKEDYDLVIMESFSSDCMLGLLDFHEVRAPIVAMLSSSLMPWTDARFGLISNPSHVPVMALPYATKMTFSQRLCNTFTKLFYHYWFKYEIQVKEQAIIEKQLGREISQLKDLANNMSLLLVNTFYPLNGVNPTLPAIVEVGGMHLDPVRKPIPHVSK